VLSGVDLAVLSGSVSHYPDLIVRERLELLAHAVPEPSPAVDEALAQVSLEGRITSPPVRPRSCAWRPCGSARAALVRWIAAEAARGTAVLLVSHDPVLVDACADRVLTLIVGTLHDDAPPDAATAARDRDSGPEDPDTRLERRIDATT
jgi:hypothetical protein